MEGKKKTPPIPRKSEHDANRTKLKRQELKPKTHGNTIVSFIALTMTY